MTYQSILVPIDLTEDALTQKALAHVEFLANASTATITFLHVLPIFLPILSAYSIEYSTKELDDAKAKARKAINKLIQHLDLPKERVNIFTSFGSARTETLKAAEIAKADLIIVGSRNPSLSTHLLGSTAAGIVANAKISVLVVR